VGSTFLFDRRDLSSALPVWPEEDFQALLDHNVHPLGDARVCWEYCSNSGRAGITSDKGKLARYMRFALMTAERSVVSGWCSRPNKLNDANP
jgi:hypothetical protein